MSLASREEAHIHKAAAANALLWTPRTNTCAVKTEEVRRPAFACRRRTNRTVSGLVNKPRSNGAAMSRERSAAEQATTALVCSKNEERDAQAGRKQRV